MACQIDDTIMHTGDDIAHFLPRLPCIAKSPVVLITATDGASDSEVDDDLT